MKLLNKKINKEILKKNKRIIGVYISLFNYYYFVVKIE